MILAGFDLASRSTGYCVGSGAHVPEAGAWAFPQCGDDLGRMLDLFDRELVNLIETHKVERAAFEAPIKRQHDTLLTARKLYGLASHLEWVCHRRGILCHEVDLRAVKRSLSGGAAASKDDMVFCARKIGVVLPTKGTDDAADAVGCWLTLLRAVDKHSSMEFDKALYGQRRSFLI